MRILFIFLLVLGWGATPAEAASPEASAKPASVAAGTQPASPSTPADPAKPVPKETTLQEGREIAKKEVGGGEIKRENTWRKSEYDYDHEIYSFSIIKPDKSLVEVDVDPKTGFVIGVTYKKVESSAALPPAKITKAEAQKFAIKAVDEQFGTPGSGLRSGTATHSEYNVFNSKPAYIVQVKKGMKNYTVYLSPEDGKVLQVDAPR